IPISVATAGSSITQRTWQKRLPSTSAPSRKLCNTSRTGAALGLVRATGQWSREPLNDAKVFEKAAPGGQATVRRQRFVRAGNGEFARQRVQNNLVLPFTRQVNGNQCGRCIHCPTFYYSKLTLPTTSIAEIRLKEVDANEITVRFWQEIYDDAGKLVETHEKFPVDKGHQKV